MLSITLRATLKEGGRGAELLRGGVEEEIAHPILTKGCFWISTLKNRILWKNGIILQYNSDYLHTAHLN